LGNDENQEESIDININWEELYGENKKKKYLLAPDSICCPITLEPMKKAFVTPDGISYDECSLKNLIARGNFVDPTTRNKYHPDQLVPNENLSSFIKELLLNHPELEFSGFDAIVF